MYSKALRENVKRECLYTRAKIDFFQGKVEKYVIFPAGPTAQRFFYTLKDECGIEAEFFVDNNPELENKSVCGKQVKSFDTAFPKNQAWDDYIVLIPTTVKYYRQITAQLDEAGISSYFYAAAFIAHKLWERYDKVADMLGDEYSKVSYWGAIYDLITGNNKFIAQDPSPNYFSVMEFTSLEHEIIVDAGAYVGDTVEEYVKRSVGSAKIYAFEPNKELMNRLQQRKSRLEKEYVLCDNAIEIIPAGLGAETKTSRFQAGDLTMLKPDEHGDIALPIYSIDDFFRDKPPFTLLKADIEGAEMDMLRGGAYMISRYKPKMTLCIYHSPHDFAQIAEYVRFLVPEYDLYIRSHRSYFGDTILYCITKE